jgi:hypothetical protein
MIQIMIDRNQNSYPSIIDLNFNHVLKSIVQIG